VKNYDTIVIGAGIIGLSIAYELKLRNPKLRIVVLEKNSAGKEASWASAGMLEPNLVINAETAEEEIHRRFFNLCVESQILFEEFIRRIEWFSKVDCEYRKEGILKLIPPGESPGKEMAHLARLGVRTHYWEPEVAESFEPALAEGYSAIHLPDHHQVENRKIIEALLIACRQMRIEIVDHCSVSDFVILNDSVSAVHALTDQYSAAQYVLTAGSWSSQFPGLHGVIPEIRPMRGQIACLQMPNPQFVRHAGYLDDFYYVPRNDGRILIGSTVEDAGFNKTIFKEITQSFIKKLEAVIPNSVYFKLVESWSGLRPLTNDTYPILGETVLSNLFVASGHFRNGILLTPITAKLMADVILDNKVSPLIKPFSPSRLIGV
jgi:glycine oxidase